MTDKYRNIIEKYDLKKAKVRGDEMLACCPFHDDGNPSFSINLITGRWICFAGCGKGDFIDFIAKMDKTSRDEALKKITNVNDKDLDLIALQMKLSELTQPLAVEEKEETIDERILTKFVYEGEDFKPGLEYMKSRGFTEEALKDFEIGFYPKRSLITIPIRNEKSKLVAVLGRSIEGDDGAKYKPIWPSTGYQKARILYGLNKVSKEEKTVIIVEGHLDVLKAHQEGFKNAAALQGSNLSSKQEDLILKRFNRVIIATDNDDAGRSAADKIVRRMRGKVSLYKFVFVWDSVKDIGEMAQAEIKYGVENMEMIL